MSALTISITVVAALLLASFVLLGAWIDGRRQKLLNRGEHPFTTPTGEVVPQESQETSRVPPH